MNLSVSNVFYIPYSYSSGIILRLGGFMKNKVTRFGMLFVILLTVITFCDVTILEESGSTRITSPFSVHVESQYSPHDPITITSNQDFVDQGWTGNGSKSNPYLIQGLSIASDEKCISISFTDVYFKISNCSFTHNTELGGSRGVSLNTVQNGFIENCEFLNLFWSIEAESIAIVKFANNSFYGEFYGMKLEDSANCTLTSNEFERVGLWIRGTERNHFLSNTFENNTVEGKPLSVITNRSFETIDASSYGQLYLFNSSNCIVENAIFDYRNVGVSLAVCNDCVVQNLNSTYAALCLVELQLCNNTNIAKCDIGESYNAGFRFLYTINCSLVDCETGYSPIHLDYGVGIDMYNNVNTTIFQNTFHVIGISGAENIDCSIIDNTVEGISSVWAYGIHFSDSHNTTVRGNELHELYIAIQFAWGSTNCIISDNLIHDNRGYGIKLGENEVDCEGFRIYNNSFWYNDLGHAIDNGNSNYWDDGISLGNQWDDYNGTGVYTIPGSAGSVDHFPRADPYYTRTTTIITTSSTTTTPTTNQTTGGISNLPIEFIILGIGVIGVVVVVLVLVKKR